MSTQHFCYLDNYYEFKKVTVYFHRVGFQGRHYSRKNKLELEIETKMLQIEST